MHVYEKIANASVVDMLHHRIESNIESFFQRKCGIKSAASAHNNYEADPQEASELVLLEEQIAANGAGRVVLQHVASMLSQKSSMHMVQLLLESEVQESVLAENTTIFSYTGDIGGWMNETGSSSMLLEKIMSDIDTSLHGHTTLALVIDSLSPLLQQFSFQAVLQFLRRLQQVSRVGVVVARFNGSLHAKHIAQALRAQATALLLLETPSSIAAYHFLSKERKRQIPNGMDGMLLMVRKMKNGKSAESIDYFLMEPEDKSKMQPRLQLFSSSDATFKVEQDKNEHVLSERNAKLISALSNEVTFNLSINEKDHLAKQQVSLPYQHQGRKTSGLLTEQNKFTVSIDADDPDWDDDNLDDDLEM